MDTSALVKLYLVEEWSELVEGAVAESETLVTSAVSYAELRAALARRGREGDLNEDAELYLVNQIDEQWGGLAIVVVDESLAAFAGELARKHRLRGFDAIHLASAAVCKDDFEGMVFAAFDERLLHAASAEGFPILPRS